ncbi:MAG: hypothetical protein SangKO_089570 [Sandaracinaceae bacterium]
MEANKRSLTLVAIAGVVGVAYYVFAQYMAPEGEPQAAETTEVAEEATEGEGEETDDTSPASSTGLTEDERRALLRTETIRTDLFEAELQNIGGGVRSFRLIGDPRFLEPVEDGEPVPHDVVTTPADRFKALRVDLGEIGIPEDAVWDLERVSDREVRATWEGEGMRVVRSFLAGEGPYQLWSTTRVTNLADYERTTRLEMNAWHYVTRDEESGGSFIPFASRSPGISQGVCVYGDETDRKARDKLTEEGRHGYGSGDVRLAAVENVYFTIAMAADQPEHAARCAMVGSDRGGTVEDPDGTLFQAQLIYPWVELDPGEEITYRTLAYIGPKDRDALNAAGHSLPEMVDLGFFAAIAEQLARFLHFIHDYVPNWGLAIILLTLMIRLALFPLTNLSFKSMARMRQLKPEIDKLNERFKDDPEKKGAAVMELYRKHKINPLGGCLPMVFQLPVFWALYTSLSTNIELYHMPFALWWTDLSSPDPYFVLPVLLGVLMHLQQRLSPTTMDAAQAKMMMWMMPIMITVFMLFLPSGLCLYMLTNSVLGIAQQKFNEYRLNQEASVVEAGADGDPDDDDGDDDLEADETESDKPQRRRPRRKRRVRRGRA